jgi:hypothetical protein
MEAILQIHFTTPPRGALAKTHAETAAAARIDRRNPRPGVGGGRENGRTGREERHGGARAVHGGALNGEGDPGGSRLAYTGELACRPGWRV